MKNGPSGRWPASSSNPESPRALLTYANISARGSPAGSCQSGSNSSMRFRALRRASSRSSSCARCFTDGRSADLGGALFGKTERKCRPGEDHTTADEHLQCQFLGEEDAAPDG